MFPIGINDMGRNPDNPRADIGEPIPDVLFRSGAQGFEIIDGNMRAVALADLGQLVPALNVVNNERVLLKRTHSGQWLKATREEIELVRFQKQMREGRKWNSGVKPQPGATPFYRQFSKQRF